MGFKGMVVMITGAGAGIGQTIAVEYAEQGAEVVIVDRDAHGLKQTTELIAAKGGTIRSYVLDLSKSENIESLFGLLRQDLHRLDILINNAGLGEWKSPYDLTVEEWDYVINTNLRGAFLCSREAAKLMRESGGGAIVNISSTRAIMSEPNSEAYAASKGGILSLTHALALSLGPDHIRVNAISPGWIETRDYTRLREMDHNQHPSQRVGKPADIAKACLYLTRPDNDFINGTNLVIDGGMTKKMIYEE